MLRISLVISNGISGDFPAGPWSDHCVAQRASPRLHGETGGIFIHVDHVQFPIDRDRASERSLSVFYTLEYYLDKLLCLLVCRQEGPSNWQ